MSRWGGMRVHWHYLVTAGVAVLHGFATSFIGFNPSEGYRLFEVTSNQLGLPVPMPLIFVWGEVLVAPLVFAVVTGAMVWRLKQERSEMRLTPITWGVSCFQPMNQFGVIHFFTFLCWGYALWMCVVVTVPPWCRGVGWKTMSVIPAGVLIGMGVQIGARLVADRYSYEGKTD